MNIANGCRTMSKIAALIAGFVVMSIADDAGKALGVSGGRFVLGQISQYRSDRFMLDTQTGKVWQMVVDKDSAMVFQPVYYTDSEAKAGALYRVYTQTPDRADTIKVEVARTPPGEP